MLSVSIDKLIINRENTQTTLLSDVKFELGKNIIYTIVGKNGSGKTTFIKSLTGLLDKRFYAVEGKVIFEGKNLLSLDKEELKFIRRQKIKYVFQDARNSFDQLKKLKYYFKKLDKPFSEIDETLNYFLLPKSSELNNLHPYELSGGMAQRVSFALAILAQPSILILDEPTSGVDSAIANLFLLKLKDFVKQDLCSVVLVTQDLTFADSLSDKIALLTNGKLKQFLPPNEFFKSAENLTSDTLIHSYHQLTS